MWPASLPAQVIDGICLSTNGFIHGVPQEMYLLTLEMSAVTTWVFSGQQASLYQPR